MESSRLPQSTHPNSSPNQAHILNNHTLDEGIQSKRASVILSPSTPYDHYPCPYPHSFVISSLLLTSASLTCLCQWAPGVSQCPRESTIHPSNVTCCSSSNFHRKSYSPLAHLGNQPFHIEANSLSLTSTTNISNEGLGLCHMGCLWLGTLNSTILVDLVQTIKNCKELFGGVKSLPPKREPVHTQAKKKAGRVPTPTACSNH